MASAWARGAAARGKRVAFGDGIRIRWHRHAHEIFRHNPNAAPPGTEGSDVEWVANYAGRRPYCRQFGRQWLFVPGQTRGPGEIYFSDEELRYAEQFGSGFVLIEPNVPPFKAVAVNKQWPRERYDEVAHRFTRKGTQVLQFQAPPPYGSAHRISCARQVKTPDFRHALAVLARAGVFVGPEGGLHHGAAAIKFDQSGRQIGVGTPAVVIYGGFISPSITGYESQCSLYVGGEPCGSLTKCEHCRRAMLGITVDQVYEAMVEMMNVERRAA